MRILVVYCHPDEESFQWTIQSELTTRLRADGHDLQVLDLYAEGFDPVLDREAWRAHRQDRGFDAADLAPHVAALLAAEGVVFIYPTWWFGLPALLKGWLDRVWATDVAFKLPAGKGRITSLMTHVTKVGVITTCGAPTWWSVVVGQPGRKTLLRGMRALCARRCRTFFLAHYLMDASTPKSRAAFLGKVRAKLERF